MHPLLSLLSMKKSYLKIIFNDVQNLIFFRLHYQIITGINLQLSI
jgi:hypothetical protein